MSIRAVEWALSVPVGNHFAKLVLITLANNADDETFSCWPSAAYVSARCEISKRTVYRAVNYLKDRNLIACERRKWPSGTNRSPKYTLKINLVPIGHKVVSTQTQPCATAGTTRTVNEPSLSLREPIFVECGSDAWRSWEQHFSKNKINVLSRPPREYREGRWGWYFATEYPQ